ncbi:MAG: hypothetical protein M1836_004516 [Candelina mexicana]|nr:MAG: hypothetical protein M1836_004516 [Candelina mexicana]
MTFPPPHPSSQNSIATGRNTSGARSLRSHQSGWGPSSLQGDSGRDLTITTSLGASSSLGSPLRGPNTSQKSSNLPFPSSFSSVLSSTHRRNNSRPSSSPSSSGSPFSPLQPGSQQHHTSQLLSSPRTRAITQSTNPHLASSAAASTTASQGGGGGVTSGGGAFRGTTFSPSLSQSNLNSPTNPSFSPSIGTNSAATASGNNNQAGQLSKIVIAQVFLLLSTIKEDKDKTKWESQADQIRKLIDSNGMEVFSKYFRRLLVGNSPHIFPGINRPVENAGNYQLLVREVQKVSQDFDQAHKIAETIDTSEGDIFRDFDMSTFMDHFRMEPLAKTVLALAFKNVSRPDLRTKADAILSNNFQYFLQSLANPSTTSASEAQEELKPSFLIEIIDRLIQYPPRNLTDEGKAHLSLAVRLRYQNKDSPLPQEVAAALHLIDLLRTSHSLARLLHRAGPSATSTLEACRELLFSVEASERDEGQISAALLSMIMTQDWQQYNLSIFVTVLQEQRTEYPIKWRKVVQEFDRENFSVDRDQFLALFEALLPVAREDSDFDIQDLWGGKWRNPDTQLSFVTAFSSLTPTAIEVTAIPCLRRSFTVEDFVDAPEAVREQAIQAANHPLVSNDAVTALFNLVFSSTDTLMTTAGQHVFQEVVQTNVDVFLCSAFAISKPWTETQHELLLRLFYPFLLKQHTSYAFVLHGLWKQDKQWVASKMVETHFRDPMQLPLLLDHAEERGWLEDLLGTLGGFSIDLAALAHRRGALDLDQWAQGIGQRWPHELALALLKFLTIKAEDEMRTVRKEQHAPRTVILAIKTVHSMLDILEEHLADRQDELIVVQRLCIQAYPRLINYGEGFDDIIEASSTDSNAISTEVDAKTQEHYKRMYALELEVREIVEALQKYKSSRDAAEQDLFACMIHALFDEYTCYHEYPLEALATTSVLFGSVINFNLISGIPLKVGLGMILEAVRDYGPETRMYKFGLQALLNFVGRFEEWPGFCSFLLQVPGLRGTEAWPTAENVVMEHANRVSEDEGLNGMPLNGIADGLAMTNGNIDDIFPPESMHEFASIHADPPLRPDIYEEPDEDVQDKVLFVLNNVSKRNIEAKLKELKEALEEKHHQWFAVYLVEERAKLQPNYQQLYLELLDLFGNRLLWTEVLRETFVSIVRMLNAESTLNSSTERAHLKNLGGWLGSLTIARDRPILHKNISFKDLLIEGYDTQRLLVVIPFTCKVLIQATKSMIFKPPNPWLMDVIHLLIELYHFAELKLNLKFEIEVLCKDLGLDYKAIEPSSGLRERPHPDDDLSGPTLPDGLDAFDDLSLGGLSRGARNERFSPATITSSLPDLSPMLVYPPLSSNVISPNRLRQIVLGAVQRAILEIISPVVERSVTIATISTSQLIHKDFAMEPDEDKFRKSALTMVRRLAGSLALVTCKEPLRQSMTNYIRLSQSEFPDQALAEGAILMCVNDNLDTACRMVEEAAAQRAMPEIEANIEDQLAIRRRYRAAQTNEPFIDPNLNRWALFIPEPYRQAAGGLNEKQMAIYEEFDRQTRNTSSHTNALSTDSGRQVPDVLQDQFATMPSLPIPTEPLDLTQQPSQQQQQLRMQRPPASSASIPQPQVNGFLDEGTLKDRTQEFLLEIQRMARMSTVEHLKDLPRSSPIIEIIDQAYRLVFTSPHLYREGVALDAANNICLTVYTHTEHSLEIEALIHLLKQLCQLSPKTAKEVIIWLGQQDDERIFNVPVTVLLLNADLMQLHRLDVIISKAIQNHSLVALRFLSDLMSEVLLNDRPVALRADFAGSLVAMGQWLFEEPDLAIGKQLAQKLRDSGLTEFIDGVPDEQSRIKRDQMEYIFTEWIGVCNHPGSTDKLCAAFISQIHQRHIMDNQEDSALFFRLCIDSAVGAFEREELDPSGSLSEAFIEVDALAKLVSFLVKYQNQVDIVVTNGKASYLDSILSLFVLVMNHHHVMRGEHFNQKVFFRLFSSMLCEFHNLARQGLEQETEIMLVLADKILALQPLYFPGFIFGWLTLVSHRIFMPGMLRMSDEQGWEKYAKIMETLLWYTGELLKPSNISGVTSDIYRGVLRILLVLHHDFPEFLAENHFRLCSVIPTDCSQLRNLILSAYPSSLPELPDPFTDGLKVDRLEEIRKSPTIAGNLEEPLRKAKIKEVLDASFRLGEVQDESISSIAGAVQKTDAKNGEASCSAGADSVLLNALVLYVGTTGISVVGNKGGPTFINTSPQAVLLERLTKELNPEARYYLLSAIANQLRYPNSHTHYFSYALLHLFGADHADQQESDVRQQITRVLLERLIVHRPHPWGLIITLLELLKNPSYMFWELPFIKAAPEVCRFIGSTPLHRLYT